MFLSDFSIRRPVATIVIKAPEVEVDAAGKVLSADAPVGFSAAVIPYLEARGMKAVTISPATAAWVATAQAVGGSRSRN